MLVKRRRNHIVPPRTVYLLCLPVRILCHCKVYRTWLAKDALMIDKPPLFHGSVHLSSCSALSSYLGCEVVSSAFGPGPLLLPRSHKRRDTSFERTRKKHQPWTSFWETSWPAVQFCSLHLSVRARSGLHHDPPCCGTDGLAARSSPHLCPKEKVLSVKTLPG